MKRNALPKFNNPRRRIKKPKQSKSYLSNSYSDIVRISENGPRNREERRALDKYYRRTKQGKYYQPTSQNKSRSIVSTEDILNQATVAYRKNKAKSLSTSDGLKDSIRLANERAKQASNIIKSSDTVSWKKGQTIDDILNDAWNYRQQSMWDEYQKNKAIVQAAEEDRFYEEAEEAQINDFLAREKAREDFEEQLALKEERQQEYQAKRQPAIKLNEALEYASSIYGGNSEYTKYLIPLMRQLMGDDEYIPEAGDKTTYFTISRDYTGNPNELFKYVHFKTIPGDTSYVDAMLDLDWSSPENYYSHLADINAQKYASNLADSDIEPQVIDMLEYIMNTSAAWKIAKRNAQDSEQVKDNWLALFNTAQDAQNAGTDVMNKFVQMVMNEDDLNSIIQTIDSTIYSALKE